MRLFFLKKKLLRLSDSFCFNKKKFWATTSTGQADRREKPSSGAVTILSKANLAVSTPSVSPVGLPVLWGPRRARGAPSSDTGNAEGPCLAAPAGCPDRGPRGKGRGRRARRRCRHRPAHLWATSANCARWKSAASRRISSQAAAIAPGHVSPGRPAAGRERGRPPPAAPPRGTEAPLRGLGHWKRREQKLTMDRGTKSDLRSRGWLQPLDPGGAGTGAALLRCPR